MNIKIGFSIMYVSDKIVKCAFIISLLFLAISINAASISVKVPITTPSDSVLSITAQISHNQDSEIISMSIIGNNYEGNAIFNELGLYTISISVEMLSGIVLSDSAKGYIYTSADIKQVQAEINSDCFKTTLIVYWKSEASILTTDLYGLSLDTTVVKRVAISDIDLIADDFYSEGLYWYRSMPVHYYILDSNMIPLVKYSSGYFRNPVTTSQTVFAFYEQYRRTLDPADKQGFINNANWLAENNHSGYYYYEFDFRHTSGAVLKKNWVSAMAQGETLGALSLAFYFLEDSLYLKEADSVFSTFINNSDAFWSFLIDDKGYYWLEEYPNDAFCHVLNGKMAALWGVFQYYTVTRNKMALRVLESGLKTAMDHYKIWNVTNADKSYYCLHHEIKDHYHSVHKNQFQTFAERFRIGKLYDAYYCLSNNEVQIIPESICFSYIADSAEVIINSPETWEATEESDWLRIKEMSDKVLLYVDTNLSDRNRNAIIQIELSSGKVVNIDITQEPETFYFRINLDTVFVDSSEHRISVPFATNAPGFSIINNSDWWDISIVDDSLILHIDECEIFSNREHSAYIYYDDYVLKTVVVNQIGLVPYLSIEVDTLYFSCNQNSHSLEVKTNQSEISLSSSGNWLECFWGNDSIFNISLSKNDNSIDREGLVLLETDYSRGKVVVIQEGASLRLSSCVSNVSVYPNPARSSLNIVVNEDFINSTFRLSNMEGVGLVCGKLGKQTTINTISFSSGTYILVISNKKNNQIVSKLIIVE